MQEVSAQMSRAAAEACIGQAMPGVHGARPEMTWNLAAVTDIVTDRDEPERERSASAFNWED
jgi:hypothetical protein